MSLMTLLGLVFRQRAGSEWTRLFPFHFMSEILVVKNRLTWSTRARRTVEQFYSSNCRS